VRFFVSLLALLAVAAVGVGAPQADAATLSGFRAFDAGSRIHLVASTCTAGPARLRFTGLLRRSGGDGPSYPTSWEVHQPRGCQTWTFRVPDLFPKGAWHAQLRMTAGGHTYRSPSRTFVIR
jgi:hypothetical protein